MKRRILAISLMLIAALALAACGGGKDEPAPEAAAGQASAAEPMASGDAESGQKFYMMSCSSCHGPAGEGVQGLGKDMTTSEFIADLSDAELVEFIKIGRDANHPDNTTGVAMLPKGGNPSLTDEQLNDIVAYVRSIHQ